jgi:peptidoglycan/LPS O-acetylase OafA/YrhL
MTDSDHHKPNGRQLEGAANAASGDQSRGGSGARVEMIDALRGLAALFVCWYHNMGHLKLPDGPVLALSQYGYLGVHVFFVISGFIIPYSLVRAGYSPTSFGRFMLRRLARLDPPYFAALTLTVLFGYALVFFVRSHGGKLPVDSASQLASHLAYATGITGHTWINPVFWTLGIEFQFYLFVGLLHPLLMHPSTGVRLALLVLMATMPLLGAQPWILVFWYLPWFALGLVACHFRLGMLSAGGFAAVTLSIGLLLLPQLPLIDVLTLLAASVLIGTCRFKVWGILTALGTISYSLYLTHPVFGRGFLVIAQALRPPNGLNLLLVVLATLFSIVTAILFYRLVEAPSQRLASWIPLRRERPQVELGAPPDGARP